MPATSHARFVRKREHGYVLLTLIFFVAVLAISLTTILPSVIQEAKRDREEEMVHRGVQYTRAIRLYFKKNGRYPAKVEDLENTNSIRYLRKRYKDPMSRGENGEQADFKILRFGDPSVQLQQGGQIPVPGQGLQAKSIIPLTNSRETPPPAPAADATASADGSTATPAADANGAAPAADSSDNTAGNNGDNPGSGEAFGGGAMVGVTSLSKKDTIREFNKKHHYNEWQFIFDPQDRSQGLPSGPWQPQKLPGQAGGTQTIGTPAEQISHPVGQQPSEPGVNPNPNQPPQE